MGFEGITIRPQVKHAVMAVASIACALSLAACVKGTPLEGTPLEGPIDAVANFVGTRVGGLFDGPSFDDAREAKATENAPALTGDSLVREGYLTVGLQTSSASAPFVIEGDSGAVSGIDVDLASAIAGELGLKVAFVPVSGIDSPLAAGEADVVMGASSERVNASTVLGGYYESASAFFHVGAAGPVSRVELEGKRVGLQAGSVSQSVLEGTTLGMVQSTYANLNQAFEALVAGEVDYVLCDAYPGAYLAAAYQGVSFAGALNAPASFGIAAASDKTDLQNAVKSALDSVMGNGEMDVIRARWVGGMQAVTLDGLIEGASTVEAVPDAESADTQDADPQDGSTAGANAVFVG